MADTAALVVALSAQLTKFEKDMKKAAEIADKEVNNIEKKFQKLNPSAGDGFDKFEKRLKQLATIGGIAALINQIIELNRHVAKIGEEAETLGTSTRFIQQLRFALVATGGAASDADGFLEAFSRKVQEAARGSGDLYNFLRVNNIEAAKFAKLPLEEQVGRFADLLKNAASQQERLGIATIASSRQLGAQMVQALQGGRAGLKEFADEADRLGVVLNDNTIARAKDANIELAKLQATLGAISSIAAVEAFLLLSNILKAVADAAKAVISSIPGLNTLMETLREFLQIQKDFDYSQEGPLKVLIEKGSGDTKTFSQQDEDLNKLLATQQKRIELLNAERQTVGQTAGAQAELRTQIELENEAKQKNIPLTDAVNQRIRDTAVAAGQAAQELHNAREFFNAVTGIFSHFETALADVAVGTTKLSEAFKKMADSIIRDLIRIAIQQAVTKPLAGLITGMFTGGADGGATNAFPLFQRQHGGPVGAGHPYIVGEKGPELFVPGKSGHIIPNQVSKSSSGAGLQVIVNNTVSNDADASARREQGPGIDRVVIDIVKRGMSGGQFDDVNQARFGMRARKVR